MEPLIEIKDAAFSYDGTRDIFDGISFSVVPGEVFCVVGPNGCGKSTLIDAILGLNPLKRGEITLGGRSLGELKPREIAEHMAYVPQGHQKTFPYTVLDIVLMGRTYAARMFSPPNDEERALAREAIALVGLEGFEERDYTALSGGELQLVLIARALAQRSRLLIMDEPTAHLDFRHELNVLELICRLVSERGLAIIMATHFLNQAYYLENAGLHTTVALMDGKRFSRVGTPSEVLTPENLQQVFQIVTEVAEGGEYKRKYILALRNSREANDEWRIKE